MKSNNDFLFCVNPRCLIDELKILFNTYGIEYFNEEVIEKKFFFDTIYYFVFDSHLTRKEFLEKIDAAPSLKENISEIMYFSKEDYNNNK